MRWFYTLMYMLTRIVLWPFFPIYSPDRNKIPEGGAIICANHSHAVDPFLVAYACGRRDWIHVMAKKELFVPVLGWMLKTAGIFPVSRGESDIGAIRTAITYLKNGDKILMFPEGTRVSEGESVAAKTGAVRLAAKLDVPIVPVYVPREKRLFRRLRISIGEPYLTGKVKNTELTEQCETLMQKIYELAPRRVAADNSRT